MNKSELLRFLSDHTYGNQIDKDKFLDYVSGQKYNLSSHKFNIRTYLYSSLYWEDLDDDAKETFLRAIKAWSCIIPFSIPIICKDEQRYKIFQMAGVPQKTIEEDLVSCVNRYINGYQYNSPDGSNVYFNHYIKSFITYCNTDVERWIKEHTNFHNEKQIASILVLLYLCKTRKDALECVEKIVYSLIEHKFGRKKVEKALSKYMLNNNSLEYFKSSKGVPINFKFNNYNYISSIMFYVCCMAYGISSLIDDAVRVFFVLCEPLNRINLRFFKDFNLPIEAELKYIASGLSYCRGIRIYDNENMYMSELEKIYTNHNDIYNELTLELLKEYDLEGCIMAAYILKCSDTPRKDIVEGIENILISLFEKHWKKDNAITLPQSITSIDFLRDSNFDIPDDEIIIKNYSKDGLYLAAIYNIDYSVVARNIVKIIINSSYSYMLVYLNLVKMYSRFTKKSDKSIFKKLYHDAGLSLFKITKIVVLGYKFNNIEKDLIEQFLEFLKEHKEEAENGIKSFKFESSDMKYYLQLLYTECDYFDYNAIESAFYIKSKAVALYAEELIKNKENEVRPFVENMKDSKSKVASDAALRLLRLWDNEKIDSELNKINDVNNLEEYIRGMYAKSNDKNCPYIKSIDYKSIRQANSDEFMPEILIKYYISEYILLKELYYIKTCKKIQEFCNIYDLRALIKRLFDLWIEEGATPKYKNILLPFALTAGDSQILDFKKQIDYWCDNSKPSLAAFAVQALCMNGSKTALLMTDTMSKKHKSKKVKAAALEAIKITAKELGISMDELNDIIVPDLGFDSNRQRFFDYGNRKFKCILNEKMEVVLYDDSGKNIKSLPRASSKFEDNEDLVNESKENLKAVKKQIKTVVESQKPRMFQAVISGRMWSLEKWKELFVENPLMLIFSTGLVWEETDNNGNIIKTFRYMDDGTYNTVDEEECELGQNSYIRLLNTADVSEEEVEKWKNQLEDYEIIQPVVQLEMPVYRFDKDEESKKELDIFCGKKVYGATFRSTAQKMGLTINFDGYGECTGCSYIDKDQNVSVTLDCSSFYVGDYDKVTEIKNISFKNIEDNRELILAEVPVRALSVVILVGNTITAKAVDK